MDFDALVLSPSYATFGRDATLTLPAGAATSVRVIDNTAGVVVETSDPHGIGATAIKPAVHIRSSDLSTGSPKGGTLVLGGTTYTIKASLPVIGPNGIGTGERQLILEEDT
jgi:hypothetical protein